MFCAHNPVQGLDNFCFLCQIDFSTPFWVMELWKSNILRLNIFWQNIFWKFQNSITQKDVEKSIWCKKQKFSRIQFYNKRGPPKIFGELNIFEFENQNYQTFCSQKFLGKKISFQLEEFKKHFLYHLPLAIPIQFYEGIHQNSWKF